MPRNTSFLSPNRPAPFARLEGLHLVPETVRGPLPFFNPTHARFHVEKEPSHAEPTRRISQAAVPRTTINWRSRDNRKVARERGKTGRHALRVDRRHPALTSTFRAVLQGLRRMCTECPYWDISYLIAVFFTVGCAIFVACGFFAWLPLVNARYDFAGDETAVGVTSFIGATLFQVGAVLLVFEAYNENRTGCFGWALHQIATEEEAKGIPGVGHILARADVKACGHHHQRIPKKKLLGPRDQDQDKDQPSPPDQKWVWWPSWYELKTHYFHEIGFMASISLAIGATIFYITGICSLPGIFDNMSVPLAYGLYWSTYLVGGVIFIISAVLYMLENQTRWWKPAPHLLGWHIGLWNLIGGVGWTLAAALGYCTSHACEYQSELTLIWASIAFCIGSMLLWYEALDKYPIEKEGK